MKTGRPRKKPGFNARKLNDETLEDIKDEYKAFVNGCDGDIDNESFKMIKEFATTHAMSPGKMRKLLITAGVFENDISRRIRDLHHEGKPIGEIQRITGLKKSAINSYLPYKKGIYKQKETSVDADRIRLYRKRQKICKQLQEVIKSTDVNSIGDCEADLLLWEALLLYQKYPFVTTRGLKYTYVIKGGEMFVSRKESSKTLTKSSILLAFHNAVEMQQREDCVKGPKKLGIFGASCLYPVFVKIGVIKTRK